MEEGVREPEAVKLAKYGRLDKTILDGQKDHHEFMKKGGGCKYEIRGKMSVWMVRKSEKNWEIEMVLLDWRFGQRGLGVLGDLS